MKISTVLHDKYVILKLEEERLISTIAPGLKNEFILLGAEGRINVLMDMSDVKYADSSGLSALLRANSLFDNAGGIFVIFGIAAHVEKLITISQLDRVLNIVPTKQEAIEAAFLKSLEQDIDDDDLSGEIMGEFGGLDYDDREVGEESSTTPTEE